jgi:predicted ATPase
MDTLKIKRRVKFENWEIINCIPENRQLIKMVRITQFQISNLHGYKNVDLSIQDNTIILVGENGSGKTTVLRLLFYFLSRQWDELIKYRFDQLIVVIDRVPIRLTHSLLEKNSEIKFFDDLRSRRRYPISFRQNLKDMIEQYRLNPEQELLDKIEDFSENFEIPIELVIKEYKEPLPQHAIDLKNIDTLMKQTFTANLLYLPTYRRIERELKIIFKEMDDEDLQRKYRMFESREKQKNYVELIEFGMKDVSFSIIRVINELQEFAFTELMELSNGYIADIVEQKYKEVDVKIIQDSSQETIKDVLDQIGEDILSPQNKIHISESIQEVKDGKPLDETVKAICHYFIKLLNFHQNLRNKERKLTTFFKVCNQYLVDKEFIYESVDFNYSIKLKANLEEKYQNVQLRDLSSGEKQIVSLFNQLYLSNDSEFFVLIDEPELSLSIEWQHEFLMDIKNGENCSGLIAVTHSPFIYENNLKEYAHGIGEFLS